MPDFRFHRTRRWNAKFAAAPDEIKQTISNALAMIAEDRPFPPTPPDPYAPAEPIIRVSDVKRWGRPGELMVALGDILIRYYIAVDYRVIILDDLLWV